jgi:hypothetical protein
VQVREDGPGPSLLAGPESASIPGLRWWGGFGNPSPGPRGAGRFRLPPHAAERPRQPASVASTSELQDESGSRGGVAESTDRPRPWIVLLHPRTRVTRGGEAKNALAKVGRLGGGTSFPVSGNVG